MNIQQDTDMPKRFRVATEGATTDGRQITKDWIKQMAASYDPLKFGARVWLEHVRGMFADSPFRAYGDVLSLEARPVEDGKVALFAEISPTPDLIDINKARQKVYTSVEVDPDFVGSGLPYFVGLGVTDSPASLGVEMLKFSSNLGAAGPLASRKQKPDNIFTAAVETELDFSQDTSPPTKLLEKVTALFTKHRASISGEQAAFRSDLEATLALFIERYTSVESAVDKRAMASDVIALQTAHSELKQRFDALYAKLDSTPDQPARHPATGGTGTNETDY